jgi:hypothetical protein
MLRIATANLTSGEQVEQIRVGRVSSEFFPVLGVAPLLGRSWTVEEEERRVPDAVISYAFWQTHFGGASDVIGKPLMIDHQRAVVVGVMPSVFSFPAADTGVWIPLTFVAQWPAFLTARQADAFNAVARLKAGVTPQQAQFEMSPLNARLGEQYPQFEDGKSINVVLLTDELVAPSIRSSLWLLFSAVLFVLFHCLHQCCKPGADTAEFPGKRERGPRGSGCKPGADHTAARDRGPDALLLRGFTWGVFWCCGHSLDPRFRPSKRPWFCGSSSGPKGLGFLRTSICSHRSVIKPGTSLANHPP